MNSTEGIKTIEDLIAEEYPTGLNWELYERRTIWKLATIAYDQLWN
jgi:hypothetical protein